MSTPAPPRTLVRDLTACIGSRVLLRGWVQYLRPAEDDLEICLRDHTGLVPLDAPAGSGPNVPHPDQMMAESAIEAVGIAARTHKGELRIVLERLDIVSHAAAPLPLQPSAQLSERLDWRYLDLRLPRNRLIFEVQTTVERAMRGLWQAQGFLELHSPKLRPLPSKSGGDLFAVDYFGSRVYLAQSPQWYKQMAMAAGFDRVFEIAPVFRPQREPSSRHDTEFTSVDVEMSWIESDDDVIAHAEELLGAVVDAVRTEHGDAVQRCFGVELRALSRPFPRVTFDEATAIVFAAGARVAQDADDLDPAGERVVAAHIARETGSDVVVVTDYPEHARPYYHMLRGDGTVATRSFDILWSGLEIASGAQREHRFDELVAQARARGVPVDRVRQYLEFFKYGCPPHGGFGLGLTRLLVSMLGLGDVREATFLFRGPDRITP